MIRTTLLLVLLAATSAVASDLELLKSSDPAERLQAIESLRSEEGKAVSKAIAGAVSDRDRKVREAAIEALGERADETSIKALRRGLKTFAKKPDVLPRIVIALGAARDVTSSKAIVKLARKSLGADPRLASAAIDALGDLRSSESIAGLVEILGTVEPVRGGASARRGHERYVTGVRQSLREITGLPFESREVWAGWWRHARRDWRATPLDPEKVEGLERRDDGWRFSLARPDVERWSFARAQGVTLRVNLAGSGAQTVFARIDVMVHHPGVRAPKDLASAAKNAAERIRAGLREPRDEKTETGKLGKATARVCSVAGRTRGGRDLLRRAYVTEKNGLIYVAEVHVSRNAPESVFDDVSGILGSFRVL